MEIPEFLARIWLTAVVVLIVLPTGGDAEEGKFDPEGFEDRVVWHYQNFKGQHFSQNLTESMFRSRELYLANLPMDIKPHELEDRFSKHGKVADIRIARDFQSGRPLGFGFVTFATSRDAMRAYVALKSKWICGRALTIQIAKIRHGGNRLNAGRQRRHIKARRDVGDQRSMGWRRRPDVDHNPNSLPPPHRRASASPVARQPSLQYG